MIKMELWIRSQNKEDLILIQNSIFVYDNEIHCKENTTYIRKLGEYDTKERAIEILNEIENKINMINLGHDFGSHMIDLKNPIYIYRMPEK